MAEKNKILVVYEKSLDIALLFGIDNNGRVLSPSKLNTLKIPVPKLLAKVSSQQELTAEYNRIREECEKGNSKNEDGTITGTEGAVWYLVTTSDAMLQFKCKPESIEEIHWANASIDENVIKTTARNVLETDDGITFEATVKLLREEFSDDKIQASEERIKRIVAELQEWYAFQKIVADKYNELDISIQNDKKAVMREMSKYFPKTLMRRVYSAIISFLSD